MADLDSASAWLPVVDEYFDNAPRPDADAVDVGAFTLFVSRTPWSYYARPALTYRESVTAADIKRLADRCEEREVDLAIEWVHELHPELSALAANFGLAVADHALMMLTVGDLVGVSATDFNVRVVDAEDPALLDAQAVAAVSFGAGGTSVGSEGAADRELASALITPELAAHLRDRARRGLTITAVAETGDGVVAAGSYQPVGEVAEVLAVSTLPAMRRQGLGAGVTAELVHHARTRGVRLLILSAENDEVARVYQRVGFHRIGTVCAAELPQPVLGEASRR